MSWKAEFGAVITSRLESWNDNLLAYHGAAHGIALANGTVSLEIALSAAGIKPGDEVIVSPITFVASATAI